jgi:hypothetical protein
MNVRPHTGPPPHTHALTHPHASTHSTSSPTSHPHESLHLESHILYHTRVGCSAAALAWRVSRAETLSGNLHRFSQQSGLLRLGSNPCGVLTVQTLQYMALPTDENTHTHRAPLPHMHALTHPHTTTHSTFPAIYTSTMQVPHLKRCGLYHTRVGCWAASLAWRDRASLLEACRPCRNPERKIRIASASSSGSCGSAAPPVGFEPSSNSSQTVGTPSGSKLTAVSGSMGTHT